MNIDQFFTDRAASLTDMPPEMQLSGTFDDADFLATVKQAQSIDFVSGDLGGFQLATGVNEFGKISFYIKNNQDELNLIISTPFTRKQWEAAL